MNNIKLIAVDLDGTLLNSNRQVNDESIAYLKSIKDKYKIVIATGRILSSVIEATKGASFADYVITDTGGTIYDNNKKEFLFKTNISNLDIKKIFEICNKFISSIEYINACTTDYQYRYSTTEQPKSSIVKYIKNIEEFLLNDNEIVHISITFINNNNFDLILSNMKELLPNLDFNVMQDSFSTVKWIEVINKGITKYSSLEVLLKVLDVSPKEVIAFGDGLNDIEMIKNCGIGVAMGNALKEVEKVSNDITLTNDENGVIKYLKNNI